MGDPNLVAVGMSGGVDSSVAALLLSRQGWSVVGVTMRVWSGPDGPAPPGRHGCYGPDADEIAAAQDVAKRLGIEHHVVDLRSAFARHVIAPFRDEYGRGRTPNPCVLCNRFIKFGLLADRAAELIGAGRFATGHYAQVESDPASGRCLLKRGVSPKDQSYFLAFLTQAELSRALLPLGRLDKPEVRRLGAPLGLESTRESQDFAAPGEQGLLAGLSSGPGPIRDLQGALLGTHPGIQFFTVGQRRGLRLPGSRPLHVLRIDPKENALIVGPRERLLARDLSASSVNWIDGVGPSSCIEVQAQIRHRHRPAAATVTPTEPGAVSVRFHEPQSAIAPGQTVVFYREDLVLGGGSIDA